MSDKVDRGSGMREWNVSKRWEVSGEEFSLLGMDKRKLENEWVDGKKDWTRGVKGRKATGFAHTKTLC